MGSAGFQKGPMLFNKLRPCNIEDGGDSVTQVDRYGKRKLQKRGLKKIDRRNLLGRIPHDPINK